jgi:hypothetical protein
MIKTNRPSVFSQMNKANDYRSWKQKEAGIETTMNPASTLQFPDLVKEVGRNVPKKTVFEGTSLATKLKEAIVAEEEAAVLRRLKKGVTPEQILREQCVSLPLKGKAASKVIEVPDWITDDFKPFIMPPFRHKTMAQLTEERRWRRLGINPKDLTLYDNNEEEIDDNVSLPSNSDNCEEFYEDEQEDIVAE